MLRLHPAQVGHCDAARLNLLCATDLPGAEDLDVDALLHRLDVWSAWIAQHTDQQGDYFDQHRDEYQDSEPYWRVITLSTVLQLHFGVRYEPRLLDWQNWDWKDSRDVLLHGLLGPCRTGSCPSLPVLIIVIGRRLGYPMFQVHAPAHTFSRWDGLTSGGGEYPNPAWREKLNIECHGKGLVTEPDEHYRQWPVKWTPEVIEAERRRKKPLYLRSIDPEEELAGYLLQRAHVLLENKRYDEAFIAAMGAARFAPHNPLSTIATQEAHKKKLGVALKPWGLSDRSFFDRLRKRQAGSTAPLPWESAGQDPMRPGVPAGTPRPPSFSGAVQGSPIADPIAAAMASFGLTHENGQRRPDAHVLANIPELTLEHADWKVKNGLNR